MLGELAEPGKLAIGIRSHLPSEILGVALGERGPFFRQVIKAKIADTGQTGTQAPQSIHSTGSMYSISSVAYFSLSFLGWMQSTGQASTQAVFLGSNTRFLPITYAIGYLSP